MRIFIVVYERLDIIAVITFQPVCGSQPEEALSVLKMELTGSLSKKGMGLTIICCAWRGTPDSKQNRQQMRNLGI